MVDALRRQLSRGGSAAFLPAGAESVFSPSQVGSRSSLMAQPPHALALASPVSFRTMSPNPVQLHHHHRATSSSAVTGGSKPHEPSAGAARRASIVDPSGSGDVTRSMLAATLMPREIKVEEDRGHALSSDTHRRIVRASMVAQTPPKLTSEASEPRRLGVWFHDGSKRRLDDLLSLDETMPPTAQWTEEAAVVDSATWSTIRHTPGSVGRVIAMSAAGGATSTTTASSWPPADRQRDDSAARAAQEASDRALWRLLSRSPASRPAWTLSDVLTLELPIALVDAIRTCGRETALGRCVRRLTADLTARVELAVFDAVVSADVRAVLVTSISRSGAISKLEPEATASVTAAKEHGADRERVVAALAMWDQLPNCAVALKPTAMDAVWMGARVSDVDFAWDVLAFARTVCASRFLPVVAVQALRRHGVMGELDVPEWSVGMYLAAIEQVYRGAPYHCALHAADATHSVACLLNSRRFDVLTPLERFAGIIAPAVHDVGHPGVTSPLLNALASPLSLRYSDISTLEAFHCATAFEVAEVMGSASPFRFLNDADARYARSLVIEIVLATDMARSLELTTKFCATVAESDDAWMAILANPDLPSSASRRLGVPAMRRRRGVQLRAAVRTTLFARLLGRQTLQQRSPTAAGDESREPADAAAAGASPPAGWRIPPVPPIPNVTMALVMVMKCADIGHCCKPFNQHLLWSERVMCEFLFQGRREMQLGRTILPFMDEHMISATPKSQAGFLGFVALPMWQTLARWLPEAEEPLSQAERNKEQWKTLEFDEVRIRSAASLLMKDRRAPASPASSHTTTTEILAHPDDEDLLCLIRAAIDSFEHQSTLVP